MENKNQKPPHQPNSKNNKPKGFNFSWVYAIIAVFLFGYFLLKNSMPNEGDWAWLDLKTALENQDIEKIQVKNKSTAYVYLSTEARNSGSYKGTDSKNTDLPTYDFVYNIGDLKVFEDRMLAVQEELAENKRIYPEYLPVDTLTDSLIGWLPMIVLVVIWIFVMRRMSGGAGPGAQMFNIGKSKDQLFDETRKSNTTFKDVAGLEGAKDEVQEIVNFLKNPEKYTKLGGKIPKGALLVGPPGTGKTLLAKAVAGEAKVPFFSLSGSDFVEMFVGVGASRVRDLFKKAKAKSPAIIFIDEIDAIGRARGKNQMTGGNDERENTLNQLLTEMDGFGTSHHVIVMAATNRAEILDKALTRAGRFDRQIYVDLPELNERKQIFEVHLKNIKTAKDLDVDFLAKQTPGFSGADIANLCNEAALFAARKEQTDVKKQDFLDAVDRIVGGLEKKSKIITPREKEVIAIHEAGHAVTSWLLQYAHPLVKVTIVPRGKSLGAAWYLPEERQINTTAQILDEMCATLGGRAAEQLVFNEISTGALSDLEKVTKQAQAMVSIYGLSEKLGHVSYYDSSGQSSGFTKPYSDETSKLIDEEMKRIIDESYAKTLDLLSNHLAGLKEIAKLLIEKEVIFKEDLEQVLGKRKWEDRALVFESTHQQLEALKIEEEAKKATEAKLAKETKKEVLQTEQNQEAGV
ncbi:MAG: ATP-dependent zinc metalloprotease FtsH [Flavobacteriales bacterium]